MERTPQETNVIFPQRALAARILNHPFARPWMTLVLLVSDILSLFLSGSLALFIWSFVREDLSPKDYSVIVPFLIVFVLVFTISDLYPAVGLSPVEEFRLLTISTTIVFLGLGTLSFYLRNVEQFSRASFGLAWLFAIVLLPITRSVFRKLCASNGFWGEPVVLIGFGPQGAKVLNVLVDHPGLGLRPVSIISNFSSSLTLRIPIPVHSINGAVEPDQIKSLTGVKTAILIQSDISPAFSEKIVNGGWHEFGHLILIPAEQYGGSVWIGSHDIGGILGLGVRQKLFSRYEQAFKRAFDILIIALTSPFVFVLFILLAIIIRLDSPGPVMYRQVRFGKRGKPFSIWKFRTMVKNADDILKHYLVKHPELADEWNRSHKIKDDPRITSAGKFLRRFSLDELPQILNVLQGDMSLVGPRPIVKDEISFYNKAYHLYTRVKPGLTGLWQVSGRNDTSYEERVQLDLYYVNNWSIWLDIYIFAQTGKAVIAGKGAY